MMDREIDASIEQEAARMMEEHRLEERLHALEKKVLAQADLIEEHQLEKGRWDMILEMAGAETLPNPQTFSRNNSTEMVQDDQFIQYSSKELGRLARLGLDFEFIIEGIRNNETMKAQWDNLLMTMRLYHEEPTDG